MYSTQIFAFLPSSFIIGQRRHHEFVISRHYLRLFSSCHPDLKALSLATPRRFIFFSVMKISQIRSEKMAENGLSL
jgi:hypothetical protein